MNTKRVHFIKITLGILLGYVALFFLADLFFQYLLPVLGSHFGIFITREATSVLPVFLLTFVVTFATLIYLFNSLLERKWVRLRWPDVILFMGLTAALGPTLEILINTIARTLWGAGFWAYQLFPIHGGDTSIVSSVIWPLYGFHMYCFHTALKARHDRTEDIDLSLLVGIDAIVLEVLANIFSLSLFYTYIFYYFAGDLQHLSTALIFIPYVLSGYVGIRVLRVLEKTHHRILFGAIGFLWNWIIIFVV